MERIEAVYHEKAVETGSLVISACGFVSIAAEFGFMFNSRQWVSPAAPNRVQAYLQLKRTVANFATYESAVLGFANADNLNKLRRSGRRRARPSIPGYAPTKGSIIEYQKQLGLWAPESRIRRCHCCSENTLDPCRKSHWSSWSE
ncbi:unnamed protein product [Lactuca saligna]|uniref:Uncharacterized protein n=1 Tax=Lactuca saligna TaxID=75948 RepID=A0AA35VYF8_LACSI|nr:unnamed protein product [Lactuca saligna]